MVNKDQVGYTQSTCSLLRNIVRRIKDVTADAKPIAPGRIWILRFVSGVTATVSTILFLTKNRDSRCSLCIVNHKRRMSCQRRTHKLTETALSLLVANDFWLRRISKMVSMMPETVLKRAKRFFISFTGLISPRDFRFTVSK